MSDNDIKQEVIEAWQAGTEMHGVLAVYHHKRVELLLYRVREGVGGWTMAGEEWLGYNGKEWSVFNPPVSFNIKLSSKNFAEKVKKAIDMMKRVPGESRDRSESRQATLDALNK